ncbi:MAG: Fur family transcriptional regulator [Acidimicrobiales bacterium]
MGTVAIRADAVDWVAKMTSDLHEIAAERLRRQDQRYTPNRRGLVSALAAGPPMTLPELLKANRGLPQSSAYRNLALLEEAGVVRRIVGGGEFARYELAEDLTEHHHHFICSACGSVDDFTLPAALEKAVEAALTRAARARKFRGLHHRLDLVGVCEGCA